MKKQQTAVEWLVKTLELDTRFNGIMNDVVEQAKQMERQQIKDAWLDSAMPNSQNVIYAEQYYNETYGTSDSQHH